MKFCLKIHISLFSVHDWQWKNEDVKSSASKTVKVILFQFLVFNAFRPQATATTNPWIATSEIFLGWHIFAYFQDTISVFLHALSGYTQKVQFLGFFAPMARSNGLNIKVSRIPSFKHSLKTIYSTRQKCGPCVYHQRLFFTSTL